MAENSSTCVDRHGRTIDYLRISLTDVCNLRCVYCMPENMRFRPQKQLIQDDEVVRLATIFASLGFNKIRLTGGEPTLRRNVVELVGALKAVDGIETVAMTSNGILMDYLAAPLAEAGLDRVNISLDTLDETRFRTLTRWGNLRDVMAGLDSADAAGMGVKVNSVIVRGFNDGQDVIDLARMSLERPWQIRFIEMMPFAAITEFQRGNMVSEDELRAQITEVLGPLTAENLGHLDGEASVYRLDGAPGTLGFISSVTKPFCAACNRVRLTPDGLLRLCLLREDEANVLERLRAGASDAELATFLCEAIYGKPWGHGLADDALATNRVMSEIGG